MNFLFSTVGCNIAANGFGLCEEGELEVQMFSLAQMLLEVQMFNLALQPLFRKTPVVCRFYSISNIVFVCATNQLYLCFILSSVQTG